MLTLLLLLFLLSLILLSTDFPPPSGCWHSSGFFLYAYSFMLLYLHTDYGYPSIYLSGLVPWLPLFPLVAGDPWGAVVLLVGGLVVQNLLSLDADCYVLELVFVILAEPHPLWTGLILGLVFYVALNGNVDPGRFCTPGYCNLNGCPSIHTAMMSITLATKPEAHVPYTSAKRYSLDLSPPGLDGFCNPEPLVPSPPLPIMCLGFSCNAGRGPWLPSTWLVILLRLFFWHCWGGNRMFYFSDACSGIFDFDTQAPNSNLLGLLSLL